MAAVRAPRPLPEVGLVNSAISLATSPTLARWGTSETRRSVTLKRWGGAPTALAKRRTASSARSASTTRPGAARVRRPS